MPQACNAGGIINAIAALLADIKTYLTNGTGNPTPANTSLYDALTWKMQDPLHGSRVNPVQNTYYTILVTTANVRIDGLMITVETTGEDLQILLTIDGQTITKTLACVAGTRYLVVLTANQEIYYRLPASSLNEDSKSWEGRSQQIQIRKTTANGIGTITWDLIYQTR